MASVTVLRSDSLVFSSMGTTFLMSTLVTVRRLVGSMYSSRILPSSSTPKMAFLMSFAEFLWKLSKSTVATMDLILEAMRLQRSPMKSFTLKIFLASSAFSLLTLKYQL